MKFNVSATLLLMAAICAQGNPSPEATAKNMLDRVNAIRREQGLSALKASPKLTEVANNQAKAMASSGKLSHFDADGRGIGDRARSVGYKFALVGENVAYGTPSVQEVMDAWLKSPGHRKNIVEPGFREFGSSSALDKEGQIYWVQVFGTPRQ